MHIESKMTRKSKQLKSRGHVPPSLCLIAGDANVKNDVLSSIMEVFVRTKEYIKA